VSTEGYLIPPGPCRPDDPDAKLVAMMVAGELAFEKVVGQYTGPFLRRGDRFLGERADSEEAVQATFNNAHRKILQFRAQTAVEGRPRPTFLTWLRRILDNELLRRRTRKFREDKVVGPMPPPVDGEEPAVLAGPRSLEEEHEKHREYIATVSDIENQLPKQQSRVCNLVMLVQLTHQETAEVLGMTVGAVATNLCRGTARLKELALERQRRA